MASMARTQSGVSRSRRHRALALAVVGLLAMIVFGLMASRVQSSGSGEGSASAEPPRPLAVIRSADADGIRSWKADGNKSLLIQDRFGTWYRAVFDGPCIGIQFAEAIGFVPNMMGDLNAFSSIVFDGQICWFRRLEKLDEPDRG